MAKGDAREVMMKLLERLGGCHEDKLGREVGVVLSGSTAASAPVAIHPSVESSIREDVIVAVVDRGYPGILIGVLRLVTRYEPFFRRGSPLATIAELPGFEHTLLMPFTNAVVEFYGILRCNGGFEPPVYAPRPGSKVYLVEGPELLEAAVRGSGLRVGVHPFTGWSPPINPDALRMHVGVFGATGTGKSRLVRRLAREASRHYAIIIFDHTGVDYAEAARASGYEVIDATRVTIDYITFADTLAELMDLPSNMYDYLLAAVYCHDNLVRGVYTSVHSCLQRGGRTVGQQQARRQGGTRFTWSRDSFANTLADVAKALGAKQTTILKLQLYLERVPEYVFERMAQRDLKPIEVVEEALKKRLVVIDLSTEEEIEVKRAIVASVVDAAWSIIRETKQPINLAIFIDEAQNYACEYCRPSSERLESIAREGRKWGFWLLVASQRFSRDIKPGIRANLGTVFFSRLQATTDLQELSGYLDLGGLTQASLAMLDKRQFYLAGLANPLRKPILLTVDHVPDDGF